MPTPAKRRAHIGQPPIRQPEVTNNFKLQPVSPRDQNAHDPDGSRARPVGRTERAPNFSTRPVRNP